MITVAMVFMRWTEEQFWKSTPRKFVAIRDQYQKIDIQKTKFLIKGINPEVEFAEEESEEEGLYIDQVGL